MKPIKKAWCIKWDKIDEGAYYSGSIDVVYADTQSKARSLFYTQTDICDYKLFNGDDIEFINIPLNRCKEADKYYYDGEELTKCQYEEKHEELKRQSELDDILNNAEITHCYIRKGSYYKPGSCGYTDFKHRAGVYLKSEAVSHARSVMEISIIPIDKEEHNNMINEEIINLKSKLIK